MAKELDLLNRDPNAMNQFIQVEFEDVLAEPDGAHSTDCVWKNSSKCFECGRNCCYKLATFFCGICIALGWGCSFGILSFQVIWCYTPSLRFLNIALYPIKKFISIYLSTFLGPCMETYGLIFSRIHVTNSQGPPPKPIGILDGDDKQMR